MDVLSLQMGWIGGVSPQQQAVIEPDIVPKPQRFPGYLRSIEEDDREVMELATLIMKALDNELTG